MTDTTAQAPWATRIAEADAAAKASHAAFEQAIRDARTEGRTVSDILRALGTKNRQRIYAIEGRGADGGAPTPPTLTPVVYLRGAGNSDATWERVRTAMWARGWATITDETTAWHMARGTVPVVKCDFSTDLDRTEGPWYGYDLYVTVGRVEAKNVKPEHPTVGTIGDVLPTAEYVRLLHQGAEWLSTDVTWSDNTSRELVMTNGGDHPRPTVGLGENHVLDEHRLALWVAQAFTD